MFFICYVYNIFTVNAQMYMNTVIIDSTFVRITKLKAIKLEQMVYDQTKC